MSGCPTCTGPIRETVGMVCQTCGRDFNDSRLSPTPAVYGTDYATAVDEPVHLAHYHDGYPLCWPQEQDGEYVSTKDEPAVTCPTCKEYAA